MIKVADIVRIDKDSEYYGVSFKNPVDLDGVVTTVEGIFNPIHVTWNNDSDRTNSYREKDLVVQGDSNV